MVVKKDVVNWFKSLKSYKRVDVMCSLLQLCVPFELRFLGTCLEDLAKRDYQDLKQTETEANSLSELNSPEVQSITNQETRTKLALYVSLLHSCNDACSNKIYKILTKDDINSVLNLAMTDDLVLEELLSIYTLVLNHPAFSFDQKVSIDKIFSKLQEEEPRLYGENTKNKQSNFPHPTIPDSLQERIQQPIQSYQPCVDDVHQPCYTVTNAAASCAPLPLPHHHPHPAKPYLPYGGEGNDERRLGGGWSGGTCDNNGSLVMRPCDSATSPVVGYRVTAVPACEGSPLLSRTATGDQQGGDRPASSSPPLALVSRNSSPSPSRPATPPRLRPQLTSSSHSPPPPRQKDQTKDLPAPSVPIEQLCRMNDEELRDVGLTPNAILQLRSLNKITNGLPPPPPPPVMDFRKKPEMMVRSVEGAYPGSASSGVCVSPAMPCFNCYPVAPHPKYIPPPQVYPTLESLRVMRLDQESNSSASDTASDHSPPDTPGPQDQGRRMQGNPPQRRHAAPTVIGHQGVVFRRREHGGNTMVNGCDDRKVYSGDGGYYSAGGNAAGPPPAAWHHHQYMRPAYPTAAAPHFPPPFVQPRPPPPQPFPFNGEVLYPYHHYQPYPPPPLNLKLSCYNCGSPSHAPVDCPELTMEEITNQGQYKIDYSKNGGSNQGGPQITTPTSPGGGGGSDMPPQQPPPPHSDK